MTTIRIIPATGTGTEFPYYPNEANRVLPNPGGANAAFAAIDYRKFANYDDFYVTADQGFVPFDIAYQIGNITLQFGRIRESQYVTAVKLRVTYASGTTEDYSIHNIGRSTLADYQTRSPICYVMVYYSAQSRLGIVSGVYTEGVPADGVVYPRAFTTVSTDNVAGAISSSGVFTSSLTEYILSLPYTEDEVETHQWAQPNDDPYEPGTGQSTGGGGEGTFTGDSDPIDFPGLPTLSAVDTGLITVFAPTIAQLNQLANYLWTSDFVTNVTKLFNDPMQVLLGLSIMPVNVPVSGVRTITAGNVNTGVSANIASTQYVNVDCGSVTVNEYYGGYLDYSPYTKIELFLPYIGSVPLKADEVEGRTVAVRYNVDILSGALTAFVKCGDSVLYEFGGSCGSQIPITNENFSNMLRSIIGLGVAVGATAATAGAAAPLTAAAATGVVATAANTVMASKPEVERSGAIGSTSGLLGIQTPYLIITVPNACVPHAQNWFTGYPANITAAVGSITGYVKFTEVHLENIPWTDDEMREAYDMLTNGGVII